MKSNICIIPARGGSKRIPKKNIKKFIDRPIIEYSIKNAINSDLFDRIIVSTDDSEIYSISEKAGAEVIIRSEENSRDFSTTMDVLIEVMSIIDRYDNICCLYPTSSLVTHLDLIKSFESFKNGYFKSLVSCIKYSHPIQRALEEKDGKIKMIDSNNINIRTQDLPPSYHDAGQFYWMKSEIIKENSKIFTENTGLYLLDEINAQDIDNMVDWEIAELKYKYLNKIV
jgi:N-acylneuraminate cytidylyltransferase